MALLNLGCGHNFHPAWVNVDVDPISPEVVCIDIVKSLPFPDCYFDVVYHSHLIEHLEPESVHYFLKEAYRVLKPKGIMRVVTPDLENIARTYLEKLAEAQDGVPGAGLDYEWMILELFDQVARSYTGGEMQKHLLKQNLGNKDFIISRTGHEFERLWMPSAGNTQTVLDRVRRTTLRALMRYVRERMACFCARIIAGKYACEALEIGLFRRLGEVHFKLYDRYSLSALLENLGFVDVHVCKAGESAIPDFASYSLDVMNGKVRKPDSLFLECKKP